jgi:ABC-2 type transport system permease protein
MFSKALFKQSCKAHWSMWTIITAATCFMLACVMLFIGGGNIASFRAAFEEEVVTGEIDASMKAGALNYYSSVDDALTKFDSFYIDEYQAAMQAGDKNAAATAYGMAITDLKNYVEGVIAAQGFESDSKEAMEIQGAVFYVLNPMSPDSADGMYGSFYTTLGEKAPNYDLSALSSTVPGSEQRKEYINKYARTNVSIFLAGNMVSDVTVQELVKQLSSYGITKEKYEEYGYTGTSGYAKIKDMAQSAIVAFQARYDYKISVMVVPEGSTAEKTAAAIREEITGDLTRSFVSALPSEISKAIEEVVQIDMYSLIVGSIFYKMAGLLLPIIYLIMTANALIAGQVDSGSMAYILSSSTKRKSVIFTQAVFLIGSLFLMFSCTTVTSMVCLAAVDKTYVTLSYGQMLLINLGAFLTMFAMSGICYLASCWFDRSKHSMAIGGGFTMFSLVATMLGLFGSSILPSIIRIDALNYFNYASLISLFDVLSIFDKTSAFIWKFAILIVIGIICYFVGGKKFVKKDLPL